MLLTNQLESSIKGVGKCKISIKGELVDFLKFILLQITWKYVKEEFTGHMHTQAGGTVV